MASHGIPRVSEVGKRDTEKEQKKIAQYQTLVESVNAKIAADDFSLETLALTTKLLSKNPEYYTIWNRRRVILLKQYSNLAEPTRAGDNSNDELSAEQQRILDFIADDLRFLVQLLLQFPKCYWIWNFRSWLLQQAERFLPSSTAVSLWQQELALVSKMLARDERNFHGWSYRRIVVASIEKISGKSLVEAEYEYTTAMVRSGHKNFSAWHNRSKLIPRLLDERGADDSARRQMLDSELELVQIALTDPFNQSAWDYHAFLMGTISTDALVGGAIVKSFKDSERKAYFEREMERIKEMLEVDDDCKLIYQALLGYSIRYLDAHTDTGAATIQDLRVWLQKLHDLDHLRSKRWLDLEQQLKIRT